MTLFKNKYRIETIRLRGWDYASAAWYFVTICTAKRQPFFGRIKNGEMHLSPIGEIACDYWLQIPQHTAGNVEVDVFVTMPDHMHGIVVINPAAALDTTVSTEKTLQCHVSTLQCHASTTPSTNVSMSQISPKAGSLGAIIRSYKSAVSYWCSHNGHKEFAWLPRYYDRIIRDERALQTIRRYIIDNPAKWEQDRNNPDSLRV